MLKGKVAIVTGAAKGIGRAIALKLASLGADVVVNYRSNSSAVDSLLEEIKALGASAEGFQADVSKFEEAEALITFTKEKFGKVDFLVNNAGITKDTLMLRMTESDFDSVINVNLKGTFNCIKNVVPIMVKQRSGKIVNISSIIGITGNAGQANYAASKAGVIGLTKSVAKELGGRGITVNAIAPGFIETDMTEVLSDAVKDGIKNNIPLKKLGKSEDVANLVGFLLSSEADYITGQVIAVDGGLAM